MACAKAGFKLAPQEETPLAALMPDLSTGKMVHATDVGRLERLLPGY